MKRLIVILFLLNGCTSFSSKGFQYYNYTLLYGTSYQNSLFHHSFEFQFHKRFNRHRMFSYFGIGGSYSFNLTSQSIGLKSMFNPTYMELYISKKTSLRPYIFIEGNLMRENNKFDNSLHSITPGLGFFGAYYPDIGRFIKVQFQMGYQLNKKFITNENGFTAELKVGFGIGFRKVIRRKKLDE